VASQAVQGKYSTSIGSNDTIFSTGQLFLVVVAIITAATSVAVLTWKGWSLWNSKFRKDNEYTIVDTSMDTIVGPEHEIDLALETDGIL